MRNIGNPPSIIEPTARNKITTATEDDLNCSLKINTARHKSLNFKTYPRKESFAKYISLGIMK